MDPLNESPEQPKTNDRMGFASLVCAIIAWLFVFGIPVVFLVLLLVLPKDTLDMLSWIILLLIYIILPIIGLVLGLTSKWSGIAKVGIYLNATLLALHIMVVLFLYRSWLEMPFLD